MQLTCPHCQFSKEVPADKLPNTPTRVTCPQCRESFSLPSSGANPAQLPRIYCPACGAEQPQRSACASCRLIFAKYRPAQPVAPEAHDNLTENLADRPKAGFWLRLVALMIDWFLVFLLQVVLSTALMFIGSNGFQLHGSMAILVQLFSMILSLFYWVFFTGHGGQTLGKMLLRIQVIGIDGTPVSYGKAFYREVVGKLISGIIFCIGYLMAAFDDQKQALHDRMAKTYVIKL